MIRLSFIVIAFISFVFTVTAEAQELKRWRPDFKDFPRFDTLLPAEQDTLALVQKILKQARTEERYYLEAVTRILLADLDTGQQTRVRHLLWAFGLSEHYNFDSLRTYSTIALANFFLDSMNPSMAIEYYQKLDHPVKELNFNPTYKIAQIHHSTGNHDLAKRRYRELLSQSLESDLRCEIELNLASLYYQQSSYDSASQMLDAANEICAKGSARFNLLMGAIFHSRGRYQEALLSYDAALSPNLPDEMKATLYQHIGSSYSMLGKSDRAENYFQNAIALFKLDSNYSKVISTLNLSAAASLKNGNIRLAEQKNQSARKLADEWGLLKSKQQVLQVKTEIHKRQAEFLEAQLTNEEMLELEKRIDSRQQQDRALAQSAREQFERITEAINEELRQRMQISRLKSESNQKAGQIALQKNQLLLLENAKKLREEQLIRERLQKENARKEILNYQKQLEIEQRSREIERLNQERALQEAILQERKLKANSDSQQIALLRAESELREATIEKEQKEKTLLISLLTAGAVLLMVILYSLRKRILFNKLLQNQQKEIMEKNSALEASEEELKQNMEELQTTQEILYQQREMLQLVGNLGIIHYKTSEEIIQVNDHFLKIYGLEGSDKAVNKADFLAMIHPDDLNVLEQVFMDVNQGRNRDSLDFRVIRPGGEVRHIHSSWRVFQSEDRNTDLLGVNMDITELKQNEQELMVKNEDLEKSNSELDHFVYRTSHNLRAPLTSVMGLLEIIKQSKNGSIEYIDLIEKSMFKMDETIKEINDYSKNARVEVSVEAVDVERECRDIVKELSYMKPTLQVDFISNVGVDGNILTDHQRVRMILTNLISNSIKYSDPYKDKLELNLKVKRGTDVVEIQFSDNGMGINEKYVDKVFNMFVRATDKEQGSGLGLYIVREAVNKLGGTIKVSSELGKGSTFTFTLKEMIPEKV